MYDPSTDRFVIRKKWREKLIIKSAFKVNHLIVIVRQP